VDEAGRITKYEYDRRSRLSVALYPWTAEQAEADRLEAEEAGLYFTLDKGQGERYSFTSEELSLAREVLSLASANRGALVGARQTMWRESYEYDENGNRLRKTTPWGTIRYEYDAENRLTTRGDIELTHDRDGNLTSERGLRHEARYEYNGQNRMTRAEVARAGTGRTDSRQRYDGLGRRTVESEEGGQTMRTLYDGLGFEEVRRGAVFTDGSFTTKHATGIVRPETGDEGIRYRWLGETESGARGAEEERVVATRYAGVQATLSARGEAVGMNLTSSLGSRGGTMCLGKDVLGSVRSVSGEHGTLEERYEYDAFGKPYQGDLENGMNLGYTGKPYDAATGLYNYGYRDYKAEAARFTTLDPARDGSNWFAYVNNDPVNWRDPWGLSASDNYNDYLYIGAAPELVFTATAQALSNWPVDTGYISSNWGKRDEPVPKTGAFHGGIDIAVPNGTPVKATGPGTVTQIADHENYGNVIVIEMNNGLTTADMHLDSVNVTKGSTVNAGQQIGTSGNTGTFTTGGHDHFTVWDNPANAPNFEVGELMYTKKTVNPEDYLPARPDSIK
jgi:RHS repeat-associated protein